MDEIRCYHYDPEKFEPYKKWALEEAVPFLKDNLNIVGFWLDNGKAPEIGGASPMDMPLGSANVTWVIRWDSEEDRAEGHARIFGGQEWQEIWSRHPDANGYLQMEARFADPV
jgi:hypothetical protein